MYTECRDWVATKLRTACGHETANGPCTGGLRLVSNITVNGHHRSFKAQCRDCPAHISTISNSDSEKRGGTERKDGKIKQSSGYLNINMLSALAHTLAGQEYTSAKIHDIIMTGRGMTSEMWHGLQSKVWDCVILEFGESTKAVKERIRKACQNGEGWTMMEDVGWSTKGHGAVHGSAPFTWFEERLIVSHFVMSKDILRNGEVLVPGNYSGSSGGMESAALRLALRELHDCGILQKCTNIVMDRDSSATSTVREMDICSHITVRYDPGHAKKSFVGQLLKVATFACMLK